MRLSLLTAFVIASSALAGSEAHARCSEVIFDCGHDPLEPKFKNLKQLRSEGWDAGRIRKRCSVTYAEPDGCNWAATIGAAARNGAASTVVVDPGPTAARDPRGKLGPTLAPARETTSSIDTGPFAAEIAAAAERYRLPAALLRGVLTVESGGNPLAVSNKGAVGLMQLLPATAQSMGVEDIYDTSQNIMGGARFLRVLANRFDGDLVKVLSAYHAGSTRVLGRDATPFAATDDYVRKVLRIYYQLRDAGERKGAG